MIEQGQYIATIGMFDGVHRGHQALIGALKDRAEKEHLKAMVVTFSPHPVSIIHPGLEPKLLTSSAERRQLLEQCLGADSRVVELEFNDQLRHKTAEQFMTMLRDEYAVKVLVMGYNHSFGCDRIKDFARYQQIGSELGLEVVHAQEMSDASVGLQVSSSTIRKALSEGEITVANKLLGRRYVLQGEVVSGRQVGRTIGFPTANLSVDKRYLVPGAGVYAAIVRIKGQAYAAMVNIGTCPTVSNSGRQTVEANIIGWTGDLYSTELAIEFQSRLRSEQHFNSLDELMHQLEEDRAAVIAQINI
jgi:riboflavin kinase/FMN adenylyltransferase